jgi:tetratricopeptide (TPR) repeat protein
MTRARGLLWLPVVLWLCIASAFAAEVLTNDAVVTMVKAGLGEQVILDKIKISENQFDLSTQGLVRLKESGVSETVIKAMVETAAAPVAPAPKTAEAMAQETQDAIALYRQGKVVEATAAFDKLLAERPGDDDLKVWKALALLEQACAMRDANASGYKRLVNNAYAILAPMKSRSPNNPDWNFAMAKAFWLNERPTWAGRAAGTALRLRANFAEPQVLLGDLAYDSDAQALASPSGGPQRQTATLWAGAEARKEYEKALTMRDIPASIQAEALYKLGKVSADLEKKPSVAREYWERAVAADPSCRYGVMAQQRLKATPGR